jgi:hypothetical protein
MGNSLSDTYEGKVLDFLFGNTAWTPSASSWLALFTTPPTESTTGIELTGGGYTRVAITNSTAIWPNSTTGTKTNASAFQFATATTAWGNVSAFAFFNAVVAGEIIAQGTANAVKSVASGDVVRFPINSIVIQLD